MKKHLKLFTIAMVLVLFVCGVVGILNTNKVSQANAAEFTYQEGRDGFEQTLNGSLKVTFTVDEMESGLSSGLIKWAVYLIDENAGITYNATTHKYEDSNNRQRHIAEYYFLINPTDAYDTNGNQVTANSEATYTIYVSPTAHAYHATTEQPSSATDFGTDTGYTLADVLHDEDWIIGVGPMFSNWWTSGYGAPIDYYVGRQSELVRSTVYFRDFNGTQLTSKVYDDTTVAVDVSEVNFTAQQGKTFTGWYCDTNKQTYNTLADVHELIVSDILTETKTVNFYATYQRGNGEYIEFTPVANYTGNFTQDNENDTILLEKTDDDTTFTVTYKITHNDGVNSILLLPEYDTSVFSITNVTVDNTTALGTATLPDNGFDKILLESNTVYGDLNNTFMTITFNIDNPNDGDYKFGLKLVPYVHNDVSEAYFYDTENNGEQGELNIVVIDTYSVVRVLTKKDAKIEIGYNTEYHDEYEFVYNGTTHNIERIELDADFNTTTTTVIEYKYNGTASTEDIVAKWYTASWEYDYELDEDILTYTEISAPVYAGDYYVGVSAPAHGIYHAVPTVYREVYINEMYVFVQADNKSSAYGDAIVPLTYTIASGSVVSGDNLGITLSTTATSSSNAGTYAIGGTYDSVANEGKYYVTIFEGTYTITQKAITIKALDQNADYTGSEPVVNQTMYEVTGATINEGITITKAPGVNVGQYTLTPSYTNANYNITFTNGTFYINSVGLDAQYIFGFFAGDTVEFDANSHDLLIVNNNIPAWINYTPSNNVQTNANTYTIAIAVTVSAQDAANYTNNVTEFNSTVQGVITPLAITVTADNKTSEYGTTPATLTPTTTGLNNEVEVTFTVKNNGTPITLTSTTPVGTYDIVPSATSSNYAFTFNNGTYTVSKATPVLSLVALDTDYNDHLYFADASITVGNQVLEINGSSHENDYGFEYRIEIYNANNQKVLNDAWISENYWLDAGVYTAKLVLVGTDNYNGAVYEYISEEDFDTQFTIEKVLVGAPEISYNGATATWTAVETDSDDKELHNSTVTYTIGGTEYANRTFTATAKGNYTLVITPSNTNYMVNDIDLNPVYSVTFTEGTHTANSATPSNMPAVQYVFENQCATQPVTNPSLTGYTFDGWDFDFSDNIIGEMMTDGNLNIPALWIIQQRTMTVVYVHSANNTYVETSKTFNVNYNSNVVINTSNFIEKANITDIISQYSLNGMRYTFNGFWNYKITGEDEYIRENVTDIVVNATENYTFVALYNATPIVYNITYMVSVDGGEYTELANIAEEYAECAFGSAVNYNEIANTIWFMTDAWYTNTDRTILAPVTMPAHDLTVYGAYVFDIGTGDINADGSVDANDITLYRQWIVGGYEMTVLATNDEILEAAIAETSNATETRYFIVRVADNNFDNSEDIRDISITRMAIVGGYTWDNENGYNVTGDEIIRNVHSNILNTIDAAIRAGKKVTLTGDITEENGVLNISTDKNVYIDLGGNTLTLKSFSVTGTRKNTITIVNGTIVTEEGITISAPYGNVVLTDLIGYDENGLVNLAAANHSLHINGLVKFYEGTDTTVQNPEPAEVNVEKGTHIVIEPEAQLVVEQLVVTKNNFAQEATEVAEVISLNNNSAIAVVEVKNNKVVNENIISTYAELVSAVENGGTYALVDDINCGDNDIVVAKDLTLDLNNYTITFTSWGFEVRNNATLTFNGNGNVTAVEAPLYAQRAGNLVINGGTYTSTENFVIGTHGSEGRGNNTITINGGVFNGSMTANAQSAGYIACGIYVANNDIVVVNAGTFNITDGVGIVARSGNTTIGENVVFNVTGNGTLGKVGDSNVTVPAGEKLVLDLKAGYPGGIPTINNNTNNNVYVVVDGTYTFANDDASFHAARGVYDNVILTGDFDDYLYINRDMNIYLNGHTIDTSATSNVAMYVLNGAKVTINGNGNVLATEGCVLVTKASELVVNGGTYTCYDNFVFGTNGNGGNGGNHITINAGTFNGEIKSAGYVACGIYVANDDIVTVNGGTFNITNGCGILARSGNTTVNSNVVFNVTGNGTLGKVGDSKVTVPAGEKLVLDLKAGYPGGIPTINNNTNNNVFVVVDGTYTFANDDASFHAARGVYDNVILTGDFDDYLFINRDMNIYLNGHTIDTSATSYVAMYVLDGAKVTINGNGNVLATEGCVLVTKASELVVNGGTYTCYDNFVFGTNGNGGNGGNHITINAGTFNGEIKSAGYVACGIYVANDDIVTVNGGTFNITNGCGILARSGNTTVNSNVVFNVTGNGELGKVGDSKVTVPSGEALVLDELANYPGGQPTLTNNSSYSIYTRN